MKKIIFSIILIMILFVPVLGAAEGSWQLAAWNISSNMINDIQSNGSAIYGAVGNGQIWEWQDPNTTWAIAAPANNSQVGLNRVLINSSGNIYSISSPSAFLYILNKTSSSNIPLQQATVETAAYSVVEFNNGSGLKIYAGSHPHGLLFRQNFSSTLWDTVAGQYIGETDIDALCLYNDGTGDALFGTTRPHGYLLKWNSTTGGWVRVATQYGSEAYLPNLLSYDDGTGLALFAETATNGYLLKWNSSTGGWVRVATTSGSEKTLYGMTTFNDGTGSAIFAGSVNSGLLLKWNASLGAWKPVVTSAYGSETRINTLAVHQYALYAGTGNGNLLKYSLAYTPPQPLTANFTANQTIGNAPLSVQFTDFTTGNPTNWLWNFGGSEGTSTVQNASHLYTIPGLYTISLTAYNTNYTSTTTKTAYINVTYQNTTIPYNQPPIPPSNLTAIEIGKTYIIWQFERTLNYTAYFLDGVQNLSPFDYVGQNTNLSFYEHGPITGNETLLFNQSVSVGTNYRGFSTIIQNHWIIQGGLEPASSHSCEMCFNQTGNITCQQIFAKTLDTYQETAYSPTGGLDPWNVFLKTYLFVAFGIVLMWLGLKLYNVFHILAVIIFIVGIVRYVQTYGPDITVVFVYMAFGIIAGVLFFLGVRNGK